MSTEQEKVECQICLEEMKKSVDNIRSLQCGHTFHKSCIDRWEKSSGTCPICRMKTRAQPVQKLRVVSSLPNGGFYHADDIVITRSHYLRNIMIGPNGSPIARLVPHDEHNHPILRRRLNYGR